MAGRNTRFHEKATVVILDDDEEEEGELLDETNKDTQQSKQRPPQERTGDAAFEISFKNSDSFMKYSDILMEAVHEKLSVALPGIKHSVSIVDNLDAQTWRICYLAVDGTKDNKSNSNSNTTDNAKATTVSSADTARDKSPDYTGLSELFSIDTTPTTKLNAVQVPSYKRVFKIALDGESFQAKQRKLDDECLRLSSNSCFNCGATDHVMRECTLKRNKRNISRAMKSKQGNKQGRYYNEVEQKFAHIRPGFPSDQLKKALQLQRYELPAYIYRMRVLGYPRGWLDDAVVENSCMAVFNSDGTEVPRSDEDEGEVENATHKYDVSKLIEIPGFNFDPGHNYYDDHNYHNVPPFSKRQSKTEFVKLFGSNLLKAYKLRKLKNLPGTEQNECNVVPMPEVDMEIEDNSEAEMISFQNFPLQQSSGKQKCSSPQEIAISPTLADLEAQQSLLLRELHDKDEDVELIILDVTQSDVVELSSSSDQQQETNEVYTTSTNDTSHSFTNNNPATPTNTTNSSPAIIRETHRGTPIFKFSEFDKLPSGDKFKVGVSEVINFENLPESTGKYEQMKTVLANVRQKLTDLRKNNE